MAHDHQSMGGTFPHQETLPVHAAPGLLVSLCEGCGAATFYRCGTQIVLGVIVTKGHPACQKPIAELYVRGIAPTPTELKRMEVYFAQFLQFAKSQGVPG